MKIPPQALEGFLCPHASQSRLPRFSPRQLFRPIVTATATAVAILASLVIASDHSDVPILGGLPRQDANLTDLHAFVAGTNLVVALSSNPAIPASATGYVFPTDTTYAIHIDNDSAVNPIDPQRMGGTLVNPAGIMEDIIIRVRFDEEGSPSAHTIVRGNERQSVPIVNFFAGLRDDPFIRGPRQGRNIASIVIEVPLEAVATRQSTLLIWGTSKVEEFDGPFQDLAGRALRSMMPENSAMNTMHLRRQQPQMGVQPDVMIFDTAKPAAYPNGRALTDDVVDLIGDPRVLNNDAPFPTTNDRPFLETFPYLAEPHPAR